MKARILNRLRKRIILAVFGTLVLATIAFLIIVASWQKETVEAVLALTERNLTVIGTGELPPTVPEHTGTVGIQVLHPGESVPGIQSGTPGIHWVAEYNRWVCYRITSLPAPAGSRVVLSLSAASLPGLLDPGAIRTLIIALTLLSGLGLLFAYRSARWFARPLEILMEAMHKLNNGDTRTRVLFSLGDEINEISDDFNRLAGALHRMQGDLAHDRELLDVLNEVVAEGICLCEQDGRIRFVNKRFDEITRRTETHLETIWELVRQADLNRMLHRVFEEGTAERGEIFWDDRWFHATVTGLESPHWVVVTLREITDFVRNRQIQKDFLQNVTHELKTPLTSIRSFAGLLRDEPLTPEAQSYLDSLDRNTERLIRIVADLIQITRDGESLLTERITISTNELVEVIARQFESECRKRGLALEVVPDPADPMICGDAFRLEQALANLVRNALNYTEQGGIRIKVETIDDEAVIAVTDTGQGIAQHHLPYLFDRFYVADASRSRKYGGTGLGLAIVRQIAGLHDGRVEVSSELGTGSEFRILLPLLNKEERHG